MVVEVEVVGEELSKLVEFAGDGVSVYGCGFGDVDAFVFGGFGAFFGGEYFFVEFFAGADAAVGDFDVYMGFKAGELDQVLGEVEDFYRFAHVEDEYFTVLTHGAGLDYQLY